MLKQVRIGVLVSGGGSNLQALIDAQQAGKLPDGQLAVVLSDRPGVQALERARKAGIPAVAFDRRAVGTQQVEARMLDILEREHIQLVVLAGFLMILSPAFIHRYKGRILNVHPSLLPAFGGKGFYGLKVHQAALERGVQVTGATVHLVNEITDGGDILLQQPVRVKKGDTPETLQRRVMEQAEWKLLPRATQLMCRRIIKEERHA